MAKTGPQKYPGASTAYWWQQTWGGSAMESNVGVIHTTEGRTIPNYGDGASAPNFTALPDIPNKRLRWYQHFDFDVSSRALVNKAGGVETNTANAVQIELVGTCDERKAETWDGKRAGVDYLFWPDAPDWALAELAKFVKWTHDEHGIQLRSAVTWKPYNKGQVGGSYGPSNGVRLTGAQWNAYYGWLGHQHVPENDHGDPGNLNFARVLAHATGITPEPPEGDMALNTDDVRKIFETDGILSSPDYDKDPAGDLHWPAESYLRNTYLAARETRERVKSLTSTGLTDAQIDAIAEKVADKLAARLAE